MASAHELARGHKRLRALIEFAVGEGWHVKRTPGGHLKFTKAGCAAIYTSSTASDHRAALNARAQIRRAEREAVAREIAEQLEAELAELARLQRALARSGELQLPLAREKVELAMSSYRAGRGDLDALLAARNELIEARLKHIDLQGLEAIARTRLHLAYGEAK